MVGRQQIARATFDEYLEAFRDPRGLLVISRQEVLVSLINQAFTHEEAQQRGIAVDPAQIDAALTHASMSLRDIVGSELERTGGLEAFKRRLGAFLEMNVVRDAVLDELLLAKTGTPTPGDVTGSLRRQGLWSSWLAARRACSMIVVFDGSIGVPSSDTPRGLRVVRCIAIALRCW